MSCDANDACIFYGKKAVKAAKNHKCSACGEEISKGSKFIDITIISDDGDWPSYRKDIYRYKRCLRCDMIHNHLRERMYDNYGEWPAEALDCGDTYEDRWGKPPPLEIAELAFLTKEEIQNLQVNNEKIP